MSVIRVVRVQEPAEITQAALRRAGEILAREVQAAREVKRLLQYLEDVAPTERVELARRLAEQVPASLAVGPLTRWYEEFASLAWQTEPGEEGEEP